MLTNLLFLHQNFPGQFKLLTQELLRRDGVKVVAMGQRAEMPAEYDGLRYLGYSSRPVPGPDLFPPLAFYSEQVRRGDTARWRLAELKRQGFVPDLCFVHPGWGEATFLREVYPDVRLVSYMEFYHRSAGGDLDFDPEFRGPSTDLQYVSLRNLPSLHAAAVSDALVAPTRWQAGLFPGPLARRIEVIHEGIDTEAVAPAPALPHRLPSGRTLQPGSTVITYVARSLEPYRGFHSFMRALPRLLQALPEAEVVIVGREGVSYGRAPEGGSTWKKVMLEEVGGAIDRDRVHFMGNVSYPDLINLFRLSTVHTYLTYPFVLSWSLLDALSCGCALVASSTGPVMEVVKDGENGVLADFFDPEALADAIADLARDADRRARLSRAARATVVEEYDFRTRSLPAYDRLFADLLGA